MTLSPIDALVASWFLQSALAVVFTIALWFMARSFEQRAIRALAIGWVFYVVLVVVTLGAAWLLRQEDQRTSTNFIPGALELAGVLASCLFWSPVAGLLVNDRRPARPRGRLTAMAGLVFVVLIGSSAITGRVLHTPGSGPLWPLYLVPYGMLAYDAWRSSDRTPANRAVLRILALGYALFPIRIAAAKAVMVGYTPHTASGERLLAVASIQVLQVAAFGVVCLVVALALERTAILALAARSHNAELAAFKAQRLESLGRMTAGIAHDFNNMLTAMIGAAELVRMTPGKPAGIDDEMSVIDDAIARARTLVRHLLDFARQRPTTASEFCLNDLVTGDTPLLKRAVGSGLTMTFDVTAADSRVKMDPAQLSQVLLNFVTNARDSIVAHSRAGGHTGGAITIRTRTEVLAAPRELPDGEIRAGRYVVLSVADSGQGIAPDVLPHVFEPFFTTKGDARGTGLGLATAYRVITEAGGEIIVESRPGEGARFDCYLPVAGQNPLAQSA